MTFLSNQHMSLFSSLLIGIIVAGGLCALYFTGNKAVINPNTGAVDPIATQANFILELIFISVSELALVFVLLRFAEIDIVQQLEREVKDMKEQTMQIEVEQKQMQDFWRSCGQLTELWLYRTIPRLDLFREIHAQLESVDPEDLPDVLHKANDGLQEIENRLGSVEDWRNGGTLQLHTKKAFSTDMKELAGATGTGDLDEFLDALADFPTTMTIK